VPALPLLKVFLLPGLPLEHASFKLNADGLAIHLHVLLWVLDQVFRVDENRLGRADALGLADKFEQLSVMTGARSAVGQAAMVCRPLPLFLEPDFIRVEFVKPCRLIHLE
jgi:hypothetical protein